MIDVLMDPKNWLSLVMLTAMEIVLGIDNIVFITILCGRLPADKQVLARRLGLGAALVSRLVLLLAISWVMQLERTLFHLVIPWSGRDLILFLGGLFLVYKATHEIYENVERPLEHQPAALANTPQRSDKKAMAAIMLQVLLLDLVFSLDSVITAVGMVDEISIMFAAVIIAVGVMLTFAGAIGDFIQRHPSLRILALSFLMLIGVMLVAEGTGRQVGKGYIYSAMGFALLVELLNVRRQSRKTRLEHRLAETPA